MSDLSRSVVVTARPRVHVSLADMGFATTRCFGGVGFSFDGPKTQWRLSPASQIELVGLDALDDRGRLDLEKIAQTLRLGDHAFRAELVFHAPQHCGYGSKTNLALSFLEAANTLLGLGLTRDGVQGLSGRGGASGVGSHLFHVGGVVWEGGHAKAATPSLLPSSARPGHALPPLLGRWAFPEHWSVLTLLPKDDQISGGEEENFFRDNAPIAESEAHAAISCLCHDVIPAFALSDLGALAIGLRKLHTVGFKEKEVAFRSPNTRQLLSTLQDDLQVAAGMSSLGPMIYVILAPGDSGAVSAIQEAASSVGATCEGPFLGWNNGKSIEVLR